MKFGIDLGGSHVAIGLVDDNHEIIEKRTYYMNDRGEQPLENYILSSIVTGINEILMSTKNTFEKIETIGIATPGNPKDGKIENVVNLGIKQFCVEESIRQAFGKSIEHVKINLANDGKCAGLAEKFCGSLKEYDDCIFLCIGTGIGGAVFLGGNFLKPKRNAGFEFGHMIIGKDENQKCKCGNTGCFEAYCSKLKFKSQMQEILGIKEYIGAKDLIAKVNENLENPAVKELLDEYVNNLAIGIANIINIFEPEAISIGGSMSHYDSLILNRLREKLNNGEYLFNKANPPKILTAQAGNDAGIIGATLI